MSDLTDKVKMGSNITGDKVETAMPRMHDQVDKVATTWLPPSMCKNIADFEQGSFLNLVKALEVVAAAVPDASAACSKQDELLDADSLLAHVTTCVHRHILLLYFMVYLVRSNFGGDPCAIAGTLWTERAGLLCRFLESKNVFDVHVTFRLFQALMHVVGVTEHDSETQSKWVGTATEVLAATSEEMRLAGIVLEWRKYWKMLESKYSAVSTVCNDGDVAFKCYVEVHALCKKVGRPHMLHFVHFLCT